MNVTSRVLTAWRDELANPRRDDSRPYTATAAELLKELRRAGDESPRASIAEALWAFSLPVYRVRRTLNIHHVLPHVSHSIVRGYRYKTVGDGARAAFSGRRALYELDRLFVNGKFEPDRECPACYEWYVLELMGDAAALVDPDQAAGYFRRALAGFGTMNELDEAGEAAEDFPGEYLVYMADHFLPRRESASPFGGFISQYDSYGRLLHKMKHWLGMDVREFSQVEWERNRPEESPPYLHVGPEYAAEPAEDLRTCRVIYDNWRAVLQGVDAENLDGLRADPAQLYEVFLAGGKPEVAAALLEAWGFFVLSLARLNARLDLCLAAAAALIKSAHWYRTAGIPVLSQLLSERALFELTTGEAVDDP